MKGEAFIPPAEKVRSAGRLVEEAALLMHPGAPAEDHNLHVTARETANAVTMLFGVLAMKAGAEYREALRVNDCSRAKVQLGSLFGAVLELDKRALQTLVEDTTFPYRADAQLVLQLRVSLDGEGRHD